MDRRLFLAAAAGALATPLLARAPSDPASLMTRWRVEASEGHDAIAFLGPLSGEALYQRYYAQDATTFGARLPEAIRADIAALWKDAGAADFGLLGPSLSTVLSAANLTDIDRVIAALRDLDGLVLPGYRASDYWGAQDWAWLTARSPHLIAIFEAMRDAGFAAFRTERVGDIDARVVQVRVDLSRYDVVSWQRKLTGRDFMPEIGVVLLHFSKPHGIRVQNQTFLQAADYDIATTVRIAAHEMLHPPIPMDGPVAKAVIARLEQDALIMRIVCEHDPRWGYTSLEGYLNEDLCEALDQIISERLGVARAPGKRWHDADDGMHVLAAGLYGLLMQDGWARTGGSIAQWLNEALAAGRLDPPVLHASAAQVLGRPQDGLWPLPAE